LKKAESLVSGNAGAPIACCNITLLDDRKLPAGARCNASKKAPGAARPVCAEGCCGKVVGTSETTGVDIEICGGKADKNRPVYSAPKGKPNAVTDSVFTCIMGATKIASSVTAVIATAYMMA